MFDYDFNNFEFDTDDDGTADAIIEDFDTTGDGYADTHIESYDTNNSGMVDTVVVMHDSTGDGIYDTFAKMHDYNQDGEIDSVNIHNDLDGDGQYELLTKAYDSTNDGQLDTIDVYFDFDGSGQSDMHNVYAFDPNSGQIIPTSASVFEVGGTYSTELENFNPDTVTDPEQICGNPAEAIEVWEHQGDTNRCALYSEKFVIEELTGENIDIEEFADIAEENGWFTENSGTAFLNMNNMLDLYGIKNEMTFHNTIEDIENCLNDGGKVIVSIDSSEIWYGEDNNIFAPESSANHAVEVIGVNRTNPDNPMVILNDSGSPSGRGEMVPLDVFEGAWEDGDCQMISCYKA